MSISYLLLVILALSAVGFFLGRARALQSAGGDKRSLHSQPQHYGWHVAILASAPALLVLVAWLLVQFIAVPNAVLQAIPQSEIDAVGSRDLVMTQIQDVANGIDQAVAQGVMSPDQAENIRTEFTNVRDRLAEIGVALGSDVTPVVLEGAQEFRLKMNAWSFWRGIVVLLIAVAGFALALARTHKDFRSRNVVENAILVVLVAAASIAIFTTIGIVLSMLFETMRFFDSYSPARFFFGTEWAPNFRGNSDLGFLPLLWGTLYISVVALMVAVPIGLFAAIYLSEYASNGLRSVAKPLLEILAGIPTIVYGLFALTTFGPLLLGLFGQGGALGVQWMADGRSVITAGIVMGIMLIPFVSSLSDDIINAVPQAMRDGSYGLGATQSETVKQVILPAALPGIVGAILLAASRAIGETMIVVMGAGATAAVFYESPDRYLNPFEIMTTITTRVVAQLTGDGQFNSPETLVAFALGLTLFCLTLLLNVYALYIVRKYQEQYV
ncbi:MAG: phosphate ABC transporter permease subunit PstC [Pseudomonadota bacterium]